MISDTTKSSADVAFDNVFEERAENLSKEELEAWTSLTPKDKQNLSKLKGAGAKLLTGPRGSGKSTLMRLAYFELLEEQEAFPVYVNYSQSLALEPLFHSHANASLIFRQWMLCRIVMGAAETAKQLGVPLSGDFGRLAKQARAIVAGLENGEISSDSSLLVSPSVLVEWLENHCEINSFRRAVLLLDDAAHAFSSEQQSDFFEVFRQLRTRLVAPKAAVYPGITTYSPNFHVGHEAEQLNAWYDADDPQYLKSMRGLLVRRFPTSIQQKLSGKEELVELLALCAFGIPRGFLNMLSTLVDRIEEGGVTRSGWAEGRPIVESHSESVRKVFKTLEVRLPKFRNFVEVGEELERAMLEQLRRSNSTKEDPRNKTTRIGIEEPLTPGLERVLHMLEYSGVVRDIGSQTRGGKGSYRKFMIHHSLVATENALSLGRSFSLRSVCDGLASKDAHSLVRMKATSLLGANYENRCRINLSPCPKCGTERVFDEQKYCMKCGSELRDSSVYAKLLNAAVEVLPLPARKVRGIMDATTLRTVGDILADDQQQLLRVPYIGPEWAKRIHAAALDFVSV